jgi:hypothetical protein
MNALDIHDVVFRNDDDDAADRFVENLNLCVPYSPEEIHARKLADFAPYYRQKDLPTGFYSRVNLVDAADLLASPPKPIEYLIDGLLPSGTCGDLFGMPGAGKSTLTLDLLTTLASGVGNWHGLKCAAGAVAVIGGERKNADAFQRDLHRGRNKNIRAGQLLAPSPASGDNAIWAWEKRAEQWRLTGWGQDLTAFLQHEKPVLVCLDTVMSIARGSDLLDQPQQYALGETIINWTNTLKTTSLTVSHTNQASHQQEVDERLNYLSRAGGNGFAGAVRWMAGLSRLRGSDTLSKKLGLVERASNERLIAAGASKHNEMPRPYWSHMYPSIFKLEDHGGLTLVRDGREVRESIINFDSTNKDVGPASKGGRKNGI